MEAGGQSSQVDAPRSAQEPSIRPLALEYQRDRPLRQRSFRSDLSQVLKASSSVAQSPMLVYRDWASAAVCAHQGMVPYEHLEFGRQREWQNEIFPELVAPS